MTFLFSWTSLKSDLINIRTILFISYSNKNDADLAENGGEDEANSLPELPSFFKGKTFFLYGTFQPSERRTMFRFITAYDGYVKSNTHQSQLIELLDQVT